MVRSHSPLQIILSSSPSSVGSEHHPYKVGVSSSNLEGRTETKYGPLAQWIEQKISNLCVSGSSPEWITRDKINNMCGYGGIGRHP